MAIDFSNRIKAEAINRYIRIEDSALAIPKAIDQIIIDLKALIDFGMDNAEHFDAADLQFMEQKYAAFKQMLVAKYNQLPAKLT